MRSNDLDFPVSCSISGVKDSMGQPEGDCGEHSLPMKANVFFCHMGELSFPNTLKLGVDISHTLSRECE